MKTITLELRPEDAEPILRQAADDAAKYSALCDHITSKTWNAPGPHPLADAKKEWLARFLKAKRIVEAFGVEYEQTSEPETLTVHYDYIGGKRTIMNLPTIGPVGVTRGSVPDYKNPRPAYASWHSEACRHAAERVVRRWRELISAAKAA